MSETVWPFTGRNVSRPVTRLTPSTPFCRDRLADRRRPTLWNPETDS